MADREAPYDPYIPSGAAAPGGSQGQHGGNQRTAALQAVGSSSSVCHSHDGVNGFYRIETPVVDLSTVALIGTCPIPSSQQSA